MIANCTGAERQLEFLKEDFHDALVWLFNGAVAWDAAHRKQNAGLHLTPFSFFTSIVQARALYEFFYKRGGRRCDDLRSTDFAPNWRPCESSLYKTYMTDGRPAQKRVFHLVRNRCIHEGGEGPDRLNQQVLNLAKELRKLTEEFAANAEPTFSDEIRSALARALEEANKTAKYYSIPCPV
jgi:hypothetical protein